MSVFSRGNDHWFAVDGTLGCFGEAFVIMEILSHDAKACYMLNYVNATIPFCQRFDGEVE